MSTKSTKFENIVNIMIALDMTPKLENLIMQEKFTSIDEIRNEKKHKRKKSKKRLISWKR